MRKPKDTDAYFFVDESGDTDFYKGKQLIVGRPGCLPLFVLGFIQTYDPWSIRLKLSTLREEIRHDAANGLAFQTIKPKSLQNSLRAFHAKDDHYQIRDRVFALLPYLDFSAQFVVIRKVGLEEEFKRRYRGDSNHMYDQISSMLFQTSLHLHRRNYIYFSSRGTRDRQIPLQNAINYAVADFEKRMGQTISSDIYVEAQRPSGEPCLSVIDYVTWSVQRAFLHKDFRYYLVIKDKISLILDRYCPGKPQWYDRKNPLTPDNLVPVDLRPSKKLPPCS